MLPLIVIGADETVAQSLTEPSLGRTLQGPLMFFDTAEEAAHALNAELDRATQLGYPTPELVEFDGSGDGWRANVLYGPKALGEATIGKPDRLAHTGWTVVLTHGAMDNDPAAPRRVIAGIPEGEDQSSIVWQAAPMLRAHFVVDVNARDAEGKPRGLLDVLDHLAQKLQP